MSLNTTPASRRIQIGFLGKTNSGKSSLINALTNQQVSIVSNVKGTTTDPVTKNMELLPLGAVTLIDTAGYNDNSELGILRKEKTLQILSKIDIAVLVVDCALGIDKEDIEFIKLFSEKNIKYIIAYNKCDLIKEPYNVKEKEIYVSAISKININKLKDKVAEFSNNMESKRYIIGDLIKTDDKIILVTPIDESAPKGRIILPQQQVIREILDSNGICCVVKESQLSQALKIMNKPKLVITDSQVFNFVNKVVPKKIPLTSFSILFARFRGILDTSIEGVRTIETLKNYDNILISEGCTHHRQCNDIGSVKLPNWIRKYTNKSLNFDFSTGVDFPDKLNKYALIIHCGACMLSEREVLNRYTKAKNQNIPITNYGIAISYMNGILTRSIEFLK